MITMLSIPIMDREDGLITVCVMMWPNWDLTQDITGHITIWCTDIKQCQCVTAVDDEHIWSCAFQCNRLEDDPSVTQSVVFWKLGLWLICF